MTEIRSLAATGELREFHLRNAYEGKLKADPYSNVHCRRFAMTLKAIATHWPFPPGEEALILNLGGRHWFDELLEEHFDARIITTDFDLRYPWSFPTKFKLILCMEVLEHIGPANETDPEKAGLYDDACRQTLLSEIRTHLEPGVGRCLLTTPNCASWEGLRRWLGRENPHMYDGHVRELAYLEALRSARRAGLEVIEADTWECYYSCAPHIAKMVSTLDGGWHHHRGDTTYCCLKSSQ